jgi:hypothetical protein
LLCDERISNEVATMLYNAVWQIGLMDGQQDRKGNSRREYRGITKKVGKAGTVASSSPRHSPATKYNTM